MSVGRIQICCLSKHRVLLIAVCCAFALYNGTASAQQGPLNSPSQIIQQNQQAQNNWLSAVFPSAQRLFFLLALLEVTWTLTLVVLERADFHSLASTLVRKIMWIGIF